MQNTRLIKVLKTLSSEELTKFGRFISIPYFTKGRNLSPYFKELKKFYPEFDSEDLTKENIYKLMNKNAEYNKNAINLMNILTSTMLKLLDKFLVLERLENDQTKEMILLNEEYLERGLHRLGLELTSKTESELLSSGIGEDIFPSLQNIINLKADAQISSGDLKMINDSYNEKSAFYVLLTLNFLLNDLPLRKIFEVGKNMKFDISPVMGVLDKIDFEVVLDDLRKKNPLFADILEIDYYYYLCYRYPGEEDNLSKFKSLVFDRLDMFTQFEKCNVLNDVRALYSYLNKVGKIDNQESSMGQYEAYMKMLEKGAYGFRKNEMNPPAFNNIVLLMLSLNKLEDAKNFIKDYSGKLPVELQETLKAMALARLYFKREDYKRTLNLLSTLPELKLGFDKINIVQMKILSLYELGDYETAISQIEAFKKYMKENKTVSKEYVQRYYGFYTGIRILIDNKLQPNSNHEFKLKKLLEKYPATYKKDWLLNQFG